MVYICVTGGCTGMLDELAGSHTWLVIYPTLTICCQRVVICALLDTGFKGMQVVTYSTNCQTTEVRLTKGSQKGSGCMHMDKQNTLLFLVILCSKGDTNIDGVEGQWLCNCSVAETQMTAPRFMCALLIDFPPKIAPEISMMSLHDITIICSTLLVGKPLHMCKGNAIICLHICQHCCQHPLLPSLHLNNIIFSSSPNPFLWHSPPGISVCPHTGVTIYLQHPQQNTGMYNK